MQLQDRKTTNHHIKVSFLRISEDRTREQYHTVIMCGAPDEETALLHKDPKEIKTRGNVATFFKNSIVTGAIGLLLGIVIMKMWDIEKAADHGAPVPKYTSFQALNFQLYTGGANVSIEDENGINITNPECSNLNFHGITHDVLQCYIGHENTTKDVEDRLAVMSDAVERAYEHASKDENVLKVFVAPEFFFRGRNGAYLIKSREVMNTELFNDKDGECEEEVCQILQFLENLVSQKRFENWLFMFGTVVVAEVLPSEDSWDYLFYNFGIVYKGYNPLKTTHVGKRFIVPKRYVSSLDFLSPYRNVEENEAREIFQTAGTASLNPGAVTNPHDLKQQHYDRRLWQKYKNELEKLDYTMLEYGWFLMDGHTFTIEICLDHIMQTALNAYLANAGRAKSTPIPSSQDGMVDYLDIPSHQAQISIVSSAGMAINPTSLALANEGWIILQDGLNYEEPAMKWGYNNGKYDWEFEGGSEVVQRNSTMTPTEVLFTYQMHSDYQSYGFDKTSDFLRGVFTITECEPKITVYEPKRIVDVDG